MNMIATIDVAAAADSDGLVPLIRARLAEARRFALRGDQARARQLCAESVLGWLPWICRDEDLLQVAIATLFHARAFEMLRRLLAAAQGRRVRFVPMPADAVRPNARGIAATGLRDGTTLFEFDDTMFEHPSLERLIEAWSRQQAATRSPVDG
jgi:hypothetical protein